MAESAFHQSFRRRMAVLFQQLLLETPAVDANADRNVLVLAHVYHGFDPILSADITGVDTDLAGPALRGGNGQPVVKMDIRNQRQNTFFADLGKAPGGLHIGYGQPGNLATGCGQGTNLCQRTLYIRGFGIEHGLDHYFRTAADGDIAHLYLSGHFFYPFIAKIMSLNIISPIRISRRIMPTPWT